ncbi:ABC transporter permease [Anaerocolumna xylanovorans]|uniref:ABC-2 type transport system permease protein n=1 Tax=Anaerocolumna xylanovorans DSM 12503 TaxID=1121345 RepID=A0A1M7YKG3_9FIRM|nr:ABC-2 type transport system permease protein [Anaerocolumna xylanovorans DSM 12503]
MKKYLSFFRIRFTYGLTYRAAALAGIVTQFAWGALEILMFKAFYDYNRASFPMDFSALTSYIWLQQALLALYMVWFFELELFDLIVSGNVAYELCRPISLYNMWFTRNMATRLSKAVLRAFPILIVAVLLPEPYGLSLPKDTKAAFWFLISLMLAFLVVIAFCMIVYIICFYTISSLGVRLLTSAISELLTGAVIPLPFFPEKLGKVVSYLPFASMQNLPLRIYGGDILGSEIYKGILLQVFWCAALVLTGKWMLSHALHKVTVQGG